MKILVADDDENIRSFLKVLLSSKGHQVLFANDGNRTLASIIAEKPELVFLDYQMPNSNGVEVLRELTSINKKIDVVMMSGHDVTEIETEFKKNKCVIGFLPKPFELDDLKMCLDDI